MRRNPPARKLEPGLWPALKAAAQQWAAHKSARTGAALAYYSVFSLGPLIVVVISIAALIFDRSAVQREVIQALQSVLGEQGSEAVNVMLSGAGSRGEGWFASTIGTVTLFLAAVGVVVQLKDALNTMWGVTDPPGEGPWEFVRAHIFSLGGVLAAGLLFLISMLLTAALSAVGHALGDFLSESLLHLAAAAKEIVPSKKKLLVR
jgi:membrane protein